MSLKGTSKWKKLVRQPERWGDTQNLVRDKAGVRGRIELGDE